MDPVHGAQEIVNSHTSITMNTIAGPNMMRHVHQNEIKTELCSVFLLCTLSFKSFALFLTFSRLRREATFKLLPKRDTRHFVMTLGRMTNFPSLHFPKCGRAGFTKCARIIIDRHACGVCRGDRH